MSDDPIERYLDELFVELRASEPRDARSLLAETEGHLRDLAGAAERDGLGATAAARRAVEEYGDATIIAAADVQRTTTPLLVRIGLSGWQLGALGAIAIGLSGVLAGLAHLFGASDSFLAADTSTSHLAAADCARWQALYPHASTCAQAALRDWTAETIFYRIAVGLIGLVALGALVAMRRHFIRARLARPLPHVVSDAVATTAFAAAGVWLVGLGIDAFVVRSGDGAGFWLTAAPIALAAAAVFGRRLVRDINPATTSHCVNR